MKRTETWVRIAGVVVGIALILWGHWLSAEHRTSRDMQEASAPLVEAPGLRAAEVDLSGACEEDEAALERARAEASHRKSGRARAAYARND